MKIEELVQGVMNHARDNYNSDGWDYIYECWDSSELEAELEGLTSLKSAIKRMGKIAKFRGAEIRYSRGDILMGVVYSYLQRGNVIELNNEI